MSSFTQFNAGLKIEFVGPHPQKPNIALFKLVEGFEYYLQETPSHIVQVPAGFITDGTTVPNVLWFLLPPWGVYGQAAVLHDYLLDVRTVSVNGEFYKVDRDQARRIFNEALKVLKAPFITRWILTAGVWLWDQYHAHTK